MNTIKDEIYNLWKTQEDLLQQYRSMALTFQGLTSAGLLVLMTTYDAGWEAHKGLFLDPGPGKLLVLLAFIIKSITYLILLVLGWRSTTNFLIITQQRGWNVSLLQNLILMVESGNFEKEMRKLGYQDEVPLFSFVRFFQQPDAIAYQRGVGAPISPDVQKFLDDMATIAKDKKRHHRARGYLQFEIYLIFYVFWIFSSLYFAAAIFNAFIKL